MMQKPQNNKQKISTTDELVQHEQTRLLHESFPVAAAASLANAGILAFVQWDVIDHVTIIVWLLALSLVTVARLLGVYFYHRESAKPQRSLVWQQRFVAGVVMAGLAWGSAVVWLFPAGVLPNQVMLAFVIAGICAGAVTSLSFVLLPIRIFLLLCLIPIIIQFLGGQTLIMFAMGLMSLLFLITLWVSSQRIYANTVQNINLRMESDMRQRALKDSEAWYRLTIESAPVGIVRYDDAGTIISLNDTFVELTGQPRTTLLGRNLLADDINPDMARSVQTSLDGGTGYYTGTSSDIAGHRNIPMRAYFRGLEIDENSQQRGGVAIFEDITEDKRIERMKDEFISTVSHELRTPLTSIRGSLGLLSEKLKDGVSKDLSTLLDIANRNSGRLLLLINDILDINKIESGKMEFCYEPLAIMPFLENIIEMNQAYGHQHNIEFRISRREDKLIVQGDHHRLMQAFSNLLSNAAKFSHAGSTVDIAVYHRGDIARIEVIDTGIGIPEKFQPRVFDKFAQSDSSDSRGSGGTGLGLSITRAIVEQHGGTIGFISREGRGTTFYVEIPLEQSV